MNEELSKHDQVAVSGFRGHALQLRAHILALARSCFNARSFGGLAAPNLCDFVLINSFSEKQIESRLFEK